MNPLKLSRVEIATLDGERVEVRYPESRLYDAYKWLGELLGNGEELWYLNATCNEVFSPQSRQHFSATIFQPNRAVVIDDDHSYAACIHAMKLGENRFETLSDLLADALARLDPFALKDISFEICSAGDERVKGLVTVTPFSFVVRDQWPMVRYEFSEKGEHTYERCPQPDW